MIQSIFTVTVVHHEYVSADTLKLQITKAVEREVVEKYSKKGISLMKVKRLSA